MNFTKTKKIIAAGLSALMMMCSATPVFAAESGDKSTTLNYQVSSSYDWIIHSSIDFGADAGVGKTVDRAGNQVKVLKNVIPEGKYLNISVKGDGTDGAFALTNGKTEKLSYDVTDDAGTVAVNGNVLSVPSGTNTAVQNMNFKLNTKKATAEIAGQYNGRVVYNAEVGEKKEKSSSLITGYEFNNKIPSEATSVAFTDEVAPEGASTTDLTVAKDGGVVGWLDGTTWKVSTQDSSKVVNFNEVSGYMFFNKDDLTNIDFNNVDTSNVTNMAEMFYRTKLTSLDLSNFNTSKVTNMERMFGFFPNLTSLDLSNFDTSKVTNMAKMFGASNLTSLDLSNFDTSNVTNMAEMFYRTKLTSLDLSSFNTSKVTNMAKMFRSSKLTSLDLSSFNTSKVTNMEEMFYASDLTSLDLSSFNTSKVTNMAEMFGGSKLTSLDLSNFDTSKVTNMSGMFYGCRNLSSIDLHNWYIASGTDVTCMFGWTNITPDDVPYLDISRVDKELMFSN